MKNFYQFLLIILAAGLISGCATNENPYPGNTARLIGRWKSNKELSSEFNSTQARLTETQTDFLDQMFGRMVIEYREDGMAEIYIPAYELNLLDRQTSMEESRLSKQVKIIGYDENTVVFEMGIEYLGKQILVINFEDENTYWIYMSHGITNLHAREYFSRITDENSP